MVPYNLAVYVYIFDCKFNEKYMDFYVFFIILYLLYMFRAKIAPETCTWPFKRKRLSRNVGEELPLSALNIPEEPSLI
jgi:hypothetical protein